MSPQDMLTHFHVLPALPGHTSNLYRLRWVEPHLQRKVEMIKQMVTRRHQQQQQRQQQQHLQRRVENNKADDDLYEGNIFEILHSA